MKANPLHWNEDGSVVIIRDGSKVEKIKELDLKRTDSSQTRHRPTLRMGVRKKEKQMKITVAKKKLEKTREFSPS